MWIRRVGLLLALVCGFAAGACGADSRPRIEQDAKVADLASRMVEKYKVPGMCLAIVEGGDRIRLGAAGVRKAGAPDAITIEDRFHLGSCTKAMTATIIAEVVRDTDLDWSSTVETALPELAAKASPGYRRVTLRQLLDHRSGLPANSLATGFVDQSRTETEQREVLFRGLLSGEPKTEPGTQFEYSNLGFMLAALMAEHASGRSWSDLMQAGLFDPLGMESAGFGPPAADDAVDQPWGHTRIKGELTPTNIDNPGVMGPAGRVHCSMADWGRFTALHLGHSPARPSDSPSIALPDEASLEFLHSPLPGLDYTCGWIVVDRPWAKGRALSHSGSNTAWMATIWIAPAIDRAFLVATNTGEEVAQTACNQAVVEMLRLDSK